MWMLLVAGLAQADDTVILKGDRCTTGRTQVCETVTVTLHSNGRLQTSDGVSGTWTLRGDTASQRTIAYEVYQPRRGWLSGGLQEGADSCWDEGPSNLNPALQPINVCESGSPGHVVRTFATSCIGQPLIVTNPLSFEDGHWAAGRVSPAQDTWFHRVRYYLSVDQVNVNGECGQHDHRVQVFVGPADQPPSNTPNVLYTFDVDGSLLGNLQGDTYHELELPSPVLVEAGESLFISMEQVDTATTHTCPAICFDQGFAPDRSYWSNAASTPYSWQDLLDWEIPELMMQASGIVVP